MSEEKTNADVSVVSRSVSLIRNLKEYPFPSRLDEKSANEVKVRIGDVFRARSGEFDVIDVASLSEIQAGAMAEDSLIPESFLRRDPRCSLILGKDGCVSATVNGSDHLRLQARSADASLQDLYARLKEIDNAIDAELPYAFDEKYGYLTSSPADLGTALRARVTLHLPALTARGVMDRIAASAAQIGVSVRVTNGSGTQSTAALYDVVNAQTLGMTEEDLLDLVNRAVEQICDAERNARNALLPDLSAQDPLFRAYGILKECRVLSLSEFRNLYSKVRLGAEMGILSVDRSVLDRLFTECRPYNLMLTENTTDETQRAIRRARLVRERLA